MNYIILVGIALFLLASALHDGDMGWDFDRRVDELSRHRRRLHAAREG